jgi:GDP-mannose 6-dehydrogenase
MRISIFGMGYVGIVSAACLARDGHNIVGIDPNLTKVELVNSGQTPIIEQDMPEMVKAAVDGGRLTATTDVHSAVMDTELSLVCVGTPSRDNGSLDLQHVRHVCRQIGEVLRTKDEFHTVVLKIYDRTVNLAQLVGANREYSLKHVPVYQNYSLNQRTKLSIKQT